MKAAPHKETAAYKQWRATLDERFGADNISFREVGEQGWSSLSSTEEGAPAFKPSRSSLHYIDAAPRLRDHRLHGKLFGTFYFNTDSGKIFFEK